MNLQSFKLRKVYTNSKRNVLVCEYHSLNFTSKHILILQCWTKSLKRPRIKGDNILLYESAQQDERHSVSSVSMKFGFLSPYILTSNIHGLGASRLYSIEATEVVEWRVLCGWHGWMVFWLHEYSFLHMISSWLSPHWFTMCFAYQQEWRTGFVETADTFLHVFRFKSLPPPRQSVVQNYCLIYTNRTRKIIHEHNWSLSFIYLSIWKL